MHVTIFFLVYLNRVKYTLSGHYVKLMFQHKKNRQFSADNA